MTRYAIAPWRTQADLFRVRQQLYSLDATGGTGAQRNAVNRIMAWKLRGNLPHAVESTALLIDAILHHNTSHNSTFSIRAVYSAAFCRFVTGFCDIGRHRERSLEPSSMLDIARRIDMPAEFVALRHEATHEELPSVQRLSSATQKALDWLWKVYWSRLDAREDVAALNTDFLPLKNEVAEVLRGHRRRVRDWLRLNSQDHEQSRAQAQQTCDELSTICGDERRLTNALIALMVEERFILPADRMFGATLQGAFALWTDLISIISEVLDGGFAHDLGLALLQSLTTRSTLNPAHDAEKEGLADWLLHLLRCVETGEGLRNSGFAPEVVKHCCLHPGYWTQKVGGGVFDMFSSDEFCSEWRDLFDASFANKTGSMEILHAAGDFEGNGEAGVRLRKNPASVPAERESRMEAWVKMAVPPTVPIGVFN